MSPLSSGLLLSGDRPCSELASQHDEFQWSVHLLISAETGWPTIQRIHSTFLFLFCFVFWWGGEEVLTVLCLTRRVLHLGSDHVNSSSCKFNARGSHQHVNQVVRKEFTNSVRAIAEQIKRPNCLIEIPLPVAKIAQWIKNVLHVRSFSLQMYRDSYPLRWCWSLRRLTIFQWNKRLQAATMSGQSFTAFFLALSIFLMETGIWSFVLAVH